MYGHIVIECTSYIVTAPSINSVREYEINKYIYVEFGGHVYQQTVCIPMSTNCAPLVADLFLYL